MSTLRSPIEGNLSHVTGMRQPRQSIPQHVAPSPSGSSNKDDSKPRNTGPGLLPTPNIPPSYDPSYRGYPSGNKNSKCDTLAKEGFNRDRGFTGPRGPGFDLLRHNNPNLNRPVNEPWIQRPPRFPMMRGVQQQPNRLPSPWISQERPIAPW